MFYQPHKSQNIQEKSPDCFKRLNSPTSLTTLILRKSYITTILAINMSLQYFPLVTFHERVFKSWKIFIRFIMKMPVFTVS